MKQFLFLFLSGIFGFADLSAQSWTWDQAISQHDGRIRLCKDPWNYVYSYFPFYPSMTQTTIRKMDAQGNLMYQLNLPKTLYVKSIAASPDSSLYIAGDFTGGFVLGNTSFSSTSGSSDIFVAKYTAAGIFIWCKTIGSSAEDLLGEVCMSGTDLVVTGSAGNTVNFMGVTLQKPKAEEFFVAKTNASGMVQNIIFSKIAPNQVATTTSFGAECATDPAGNIYLFGEFVGLHTIDTFHVGEVFWGLNTTTRALIKLNPQFDVQFIKVLLTCSWHCNSVFDLNVNSNGDCYYVDRYSYGQSGNDDCECTIRRLNNAGISTGSFMPRPVYHTDIYDLAMDSCSNIYYTGYSRGYINGPDAFSRLMTGHLTPALNPVWMKIDSSKTNVLSGLSIAVLYPNDLFVAGQFSDTTKLVQTLVDSNVGYGYSLFFAGLKNSAGYRCDITTDLGTENKNDFFSVYPNPTSGELILFSPPNTQKNRIVIRDLAGKVVYSARMDLTGQEHRLVIPGEPGIYLLELSGDEGTAIHRKIVLAK